MRRTTVIRKSLADVRTAATAVGIVNLLMAAMVIGIYPEFKDMLGDMEDLPPIYDAFLGQAGGFDTPAGFISAEFFSWIPLLVITIAIIGGTGSLAGEESAGTMDLLLAQPISRRRLVVEKAAGLALAVAIMSMVSLAGFLVALPFFDTDVGIDRLLAATVAMTLLGLLYLGIAMWAAAALPTRTSAAVAVAGVVVAAYILHMFGGVVTWLETVHKFQPFYWADGSRSMVDGFTAEWLAWAALLLGLTAVMLAGAVRSFERRDIASGAREWGLRHALLAVADRAGNSRQGDVTVEG